MANSFSWPLVSPTRSSVTGVASGNFTHVVSSIVAVALSLQTLDDLAVRWQNMAPYPDWRSFARSFTDYRLLVEGEALGRMPREVREAVRGRNWSSVAGFLRTRQRELLGDIEQRDLQHVAAMLLRSQAVPWDKLWGLGALTNPPPWQDKRYRADLPLDARRSPDCLRRLGVIG